MVADPTGAPRSAAVLGHPVDHSLSPVLHGAAYRALGLDDWTYERIDCDAERLPSVVDSSPADRIGYSVTMPGKFAALAHADEVSERARIVGSANTLVRRAGGWFADCTDVDGVTGALAAFGDLPDHPTAVVLGVGGTARPVLAGLAEAGATRVVLASRRDN
ncbi:shikimate dehydrogenase, partial [Dietzia sp. SLG510A3-3B2-2]|nr:shikimate dehydrogenase [Dietzia sp. SLG510A3-3B2-2]